MRLRLALKMRKRERMPSRSFRAERADRISGKGGVKQPVSSEAEKTDTQGAELLGTGADGKIGKTALEVRGIRSGDGIVRGVDLEVKTGLITGMFGLCGSGRTEFLECIYGTRKLAGGEVAIDGKTTTRPTPSESIRQGMPLSAKTERKSHDPRVFR